ncbi:MAG: phosphoribosyltransferase family protein [Nitrospirota bacterium]|nr:phosphoribosyltransferase family protein [Nitrospirota bacterium]
MTFRDRAHAGVLLAKELAIYRGDPNAVILALPRGGVVVGYELSVALHLPLEVFLTRKLRTVNNQDCAVGAVSETGALYVNQEAADACRLSGEDIQELVLGEEGELRRQRTLYRHGRPLTSLANRTVILVDDGIATGATLFATITSMEALSPRRVIVAMPVAPSDTSSRIRPLVDQCVILTTPEPFSSVGALYADFEPVTDEQVLALLEAAHRERARSPSFSRT